MNSRGFTLDDPVPDPRKYKPFEQQITPIGRRTVPSRITTWVTDRLFWFASPWRAQQAEDDLIISVLRRIDHLEKQMADMAPVLTKLAEDLRAWSAGPFAALLAENSRLSARNADLEGEDAAETSAATDAVAAFNQMVNPVSESPDVPVEIPVVEVPAADGPAEPAPGA